jgi:hypothetical protein
MAWLLVGCVDLTPPWEKVTATGGSGGLSGTGGALALGGAAGDSDGREVGAGGAIDLGSGGAGGGLDGSGGAIDAPATGVGGAIDTGQGGAGGTIVDAHIVGDGAGGSIDVGYDVPLGGADGGGGTAGGPGTGGTARTGGARGTGGSTRTGGASGKGGTTGSGGASASGGTTGSGGASASGGTTGSGGAPASGGTTGSGGTTASGGTTGKGGTIGTGGATVPDAGPDAQPDTSTLGNGLLAYYPCESASGSKLPDVSGKGNDATLSATGSYSFVAGPKAGLGNALTLTSASSGYVAMPPAMFRGLTQMTIAIWVKMGTVVDWQRLFDIGVDAGVSANPTSGTNTIAYMNFVVQGYQSSAALFGITKSGYANEQHLRWTTALPSEWRHLAIVLSGSGTGTLYVDGVPDGGAPVVNASLTLRPADLGTINYAYIGRSQFSVDPYFDGSIDELRVYDRALSTSEIQALYDLTAP